MRHLIAAAALLVLPAALHAQQQQGAPAHPAPTPRASVSSREALAAVSGRLRLLVEAQEAYFADHHSYTTDLSALKMETQGKARSPVVLNVTQAGDRAWRATGRHAAHLTKSCVIFVGRVEDFPLPATKTDGRRPTPAQEGEPVCDEP